MGQYLNLTGISPNWHISQLVLPSTGTSQIATFSTSTSLTAPPPNCAPPWAKISQLPVHRGTRDSIFIVVIVGSRRQKNLRDLISYSGDVGLLMPELVNNERVEKSFSLQKMTLRVPEGYLKFFNSTKKT